MTHSVKLYKCFLFKIIIFLQKFYSISSYSTTMTSSGICTKFSAFRMLVMIAVLFVTNLSFLTHSLWVSLELMSVKFKASIYVQILTIWSLMAIAWASIRLFLSPRLSMKFFQRLQHLDVGPKLSTKYGCFQIFVQDPTLICGLFFMLIYPSIFGLLLVNDSTIVTFFQFIPMLMTSKGCHFFVLYFRICFIIFGDSLTVAFEEYVQVFFEKEQVRVRKWKKLLKTIYKVNEA